MSAGSTTKKEGRRKRKKVRGGKVNIINTMAVSCIEKGVFGLVQAVLCEDDRGFKIRTEIGKQE